MLASLHHQIISTGYGGDQMIYSSSEQEQCNIGPNIIIDPTYTA
jgi:hypothetical protein